MESVLQKNLKIRAHQLKPTVLLGTKGVTEAFVEEVQVALTAHELIKVKLRGLEREDKLPTVLDLCARTHAELVQLIGNIAVMYRVNPEKKSVAKPRAQKSRNTKRKLVMAATTRDQVVRTARKEFKKSGQQRNRYR